MREWVCHLQMLLDLASAVIHGSESHGTGDHILLSQIRDSLNQEGQVPIFITPQEQGYSLYPQALGSLSSPPTTCRATVEVLEPASTQGLPFSTVLPNTSYNHFARTMQKIQPVLLMRRVYHTVVYQ
jgi:hypothetical protein